MSSSPPSGPTPDPATALADAVRRIAREAVGGNAAGAPPAADDELGGREFVILGVAACGLSAAALVIAPLLPREFVGFLKVFLPLLFGGALVGAQKRMRRWFVRSVRRRWAPHVVVGLSALAGAFHLPMPVPLVTSVNAEIEFDGRRLDPLPDSLRVLWIRGTGMGR